MEWSLNASNTEIFVLHATDFIVVWEVTSSRHSWDQTFSQKFVVAHIFSYGTVI